MRSYFEAVVKRSRKTGSEKDFAALGNLDGFFRCSDLLTVGLIHESFKTWKRQNCLAKNPEKQGMCWSTEMCVV